MQLPGPPTLTRLSNLCTGSGSNRLQERIQYRVIAISKLIQSSSPHYLRDIITIQPSRSGLRNPLVPFCHERSQTGEEGLTIRICRTRRRLSIFGHVRRLPEATPAHSALRLAVDARTGGKPDIRPEWKRQRGRPCRTWVQVQQIEDDTGLNDNDAWRIAHDRKSWRALRPVAGQAFH